MTTTSTDLTYQGKTAEQWRAEAQASRQREADSFERSDTDGFMSQWASGLMAREYECKASLAEDGGMTVTRALFDAETGVVASTHIHDGQWGLSWVLNDEATAKNGGKRFVSESKAATTEKRRVALMKKGFTIGKIRVKGYVAMSGGNVVNVSPGIFPDVDAMKAGDYEVIETDLGPDSIWY